MSERPDIERVLTAWFDEGPTVMPERVTLVVADRIGRQRQRRRWRLDWRHPAKRPLTRGALAIVAVVVIGIIGFGLLRGGDDSVGPPHVSPSPSATLAPSPSVAPGPTVTPSASDEVGVPGACDLISADEARNALHYPSTILSRSLQHLDLNTPVAFPTGICAFVDGNIALFALHYYKEDGADAFAIWERATGVEVVAGFGDGAVWDPGQTTLFLLKGRRMVAIEPLDGRDPSLTLEIAKAIGAYVVQRM